MPVDNGSKYNSWRGEFIKRVMALYGPIIGLNLAFMILTIIGNYSLFPDEPEFALFNRLVKMFFMIVCLLSVKEFSGMISGLIGSSDALATGEGKKEATTKMASKIGTAGVQMAKMGTAYAQRYGEKFGYNKDKTEREGITGWAGRRLKGAGDAMAKGQEQSNKILGAAFQRLNDSGAGQILKTAGLDKYTDINKMNENKGFLKELMAGGLKEDIREDVTGKKYKILKNNKQGAGDLVKKAEEERAISEEAEKNFNIKDNEVINSLKDLGFKRVKDTDGKDTNDWTKDGRTYTLNTAAERAALLNDQLDLADKQLLLNNLNAEIGKLEAKVADGSITTDESNLLNEYKEIQANVNNDIAAGGVQDNILDIENILRGLKAEGIPMKDSAMVSGMASIKDALDTKMGDIASSLTQVGEGMSAMSSAMGKVEEAIKGIGKPNVSVSIPGLANIDPNNRNADGTKKDDKFGPKKP